MTCGDLEMPPKKPVGQKYPLVPCGSRRLNTCGPKWTPSRKALKTYQPEPRRTQCGRSPKWTPSRKALKTGTLAGFEGENVMVSQVDSQPKGIEDAIHICCMCCGQSCPKWAPSRKALKTQMQRRRYWQRTEESQVDSQPKGIEDPESAFHLRDLEVVASQVDSQPKGIEDPADLVRETQSKTLRPKWTPSRKALKTSSCGCGVVDCTLCPKWTPSRKALKTPWTGFRSLHSWSRGPKWTPSRKALKT